MREIGPVEFKRLIDAGTIKHIYDVRTPKEREVAPDRRHDDARRRRDGADRDAAEGHRARVHCHHGGRSRGAADHFLKVGFKTVYNMTGGIDAWSQQVDPSVKRY